MYIVIYIHVYSYVYNEPYTYGTNRISVCWMMANKRS